MRRFLRYLPIILFFFSLLLPAFDIGADGGTIGFGALIYGWVGIGKSFGWSWLANPLFIISMFLFFHRERQWRLAALCTAAAAFLLALSFLLVDEIPGDKKAAMVGPVTLKAGYWIWLYSMAALLVAAVLNNNRVPDNIPADGNK